MATALQIVKRFYPNVTSVVDSKKSIAIEVTSRDTASRAVKNHKECALAHACRRALKVDGAIICVKYSYLIEGDKATRYSVPESISREITSFDREAPFEPGVYHLCGVSPSSRLGIERQPREHTGRGKSANYHRTENVRKVGDAV